MMMKEMTAILCLLTVSACAPDYLVQGLPMLRGQPVSLAVKYLGYPTTQDKIIGKDRYSWIDYKAGSYYVPETIPGPGMARVTRDGQIVIVPGASTHYTEKVYVWSCRIDLIADKGIIVQAQYQDGQGCRTLSEKIKPLVLEGRK